MAIPPNHLMGILHSIETTVIQLSEEFPMLNDKAIELSYSQLKDYYENLAKGSKSAKEPLANSDSRQALMDEIMNILDLRKEEGFDDHFLGELYGNLVLKNHEQLYQFAFKRLLKSLRQWKKHDGYLNFIKNQII